MKKCLFALVGLLSLFGFIACNMNDVGNETENGFSPENIAQKKRKVCTNFKHKLGNNGH